MSGPATDDGAPATDEIAEPAEPAAPRPGTLAARRAAARSTPEPGVRPVSRRTPRPAEIAAGAAAPRRTVAVGAPLEGGRDETTEFLLQSLKDLEREHDVGDIDDEDYAALRDDYTVRAAAALHAEERGKAPPVPVKARRSSRQWALVVAGVVAFAVLAGVLVAQAAGERGAGEGVTGEVIDSPTQAAGRCIGLSAQLQEGGAGPTEAIECYQQVLADDVDNPVALTYLGWTLYLTAQQVAGSLSQEELADLYVQAHRQLDLAVEADPRYADARAFQVVLAVNEGRFADAAEHLAAFDELDAPADMGLLIDGQRQQITDGLAATEDGAPTSTESSTTTTAPG